MRTDANRIALRAIRSILSSPRAFDLTVGSTAVTCRPTVATAAPWPSAAAGLTEANDGPWPPPLTIHCAWQGGTCRLELSVYRWASGKYLDDLCLEIIATPGRAVIFVNVSNEVEDAEDGVQVKLPVRFFVTKRNSLIADSVAAALNAGLQAMLGDSQLPILGKNTAELCRLEVPGGAVLPSPEEVLRRLIQLALLKLDFIDRGHIAQRGAPLVDLTTWLPPDVLSSLPIEVDPGEDDDEDKDEDDKLPLNQILYGPPGTGKTHHLSSELFDRFRSSSTRADVLAGLADQTSWAELVALALHDLGGSAKVPQLAQHPLVQAKFATSSIKAPSARLWATLQSHTIEGSSTVAYTRRTGEQYFDKGEDSTWRLAVPLPEELASAAQSLGSSIVGTKVDHFTFVTFHQAYGYEDFIEGIRPRLEPLPDDDGGELSYVLEDGTFLRACRAALRLAGFEGSLHDFCGLTREQRERQFEQAPRYAVFIDEINRGNVARIFGELITLLEDDKRLGAKHELVVTLPYSRKRFGVPPNLHVIGTMNTADRSVEALDTALRRRFEFRELPPRPNLLSWKMEGDVDLALLLATINQRIELLYDRDHCIGHAFFMPLEQTPTLAKLKDIFKHKIVPLLQEYFFGDWGKIGLVLGKDFVRRRDQPRSPFADFPHDDRGLLSEKPTWVLADLDALSNQTFQGIYADAADR